MTHQSHHGCLIAAPQSGSGKTLVTLGLLRALVRSDVTVKSAKVGPDYIDPAFHEEAGGRPCVNLDLWAMGTAQVSGLAASDDYLLVEGVMGLFDGADDGFGSSADVAASLKLPVVLVVDSRAQSWSAAALLQGFKTFRTDINLAGVIFNKVSSARHESILRRAAKSVDIPCLGAIPRLEKLTMPSRHLGLVQAREQGDLDAMINHAADMMESHVDLDAINTLERENACGEINVSPPLPPLGQRIALAQDEAFSFIYPHLVESWRKQGAEIISFSPLANDVPNASADAVFLPGGYPELHAGRLAANANFLDGLRRLSDDALIYGECGGFMVLGERLIDGQGGSHKMAGLLPVTTSFEKRTRHLGYRRLKHESALPWPARLRGHEFHYSTLMEQRDGTPLFEAENAVGEALAPMGLAQGRCIGSYAHVISAEVSA